MTPLAALVTVSAWLLFAAPSASAECVTDPLGGTTCGGPYAYGAQTCERGYEYVGGSLYHYHPVLKTYVVADAFRGCTEGSMFQSANVHATAGGAYAGAGAYDTEDGNADYSGSGADAYAGAGGTFIVVGYYEYDNQGSGACVVYLHTSAGDHAEPCLV